MKTRKISPFLLVFIFLACTNNEDILTPLTLSKDLNFIEIMEQNIVIKDKFNASLHRNSGKVDNALSEVRKTIDGGIMRL